MRAARALLIVAALLAGAAPAASAQENPLGAERFERLAGDISRAWIPRQTADGFFEDPIVGRPARGYANVLVGLGLLRAGEYEAGRRAVESTLEEPPAERGVLDLLAFASAYTQLEDPPPSWDEHLAGFGEPKVGAKAAPCVEDPACFHNHEIIEAVAQLEALATGVRSTRAGARLADRAATRRLALDLIGTVVPRVAATTARSSGPGPRAGFGLLSDTPIFPLSYHALSTSMLARALALLGRDAPTPARAALRRAVDASAALAGPDGDVAYISSRQQQAWALVATAHAALTARRLFPTETARYGELARRVLARLEREHGVDERGLAMVPRFRARADSYRGLDANSLTGNGLAVLFLHWAIDEAAKADAEAEREPRRPGGRAERSVKLPADRGWLLDPSQNGFATLRRGDVWLAVHRSPRPPDLRYDFGLVALKLRRPDGRWVDLVRPRPRTPTGIDSAGPLIVRDGRRWIPVGERISIRSGRAIEVEGSLRDEHGAVLRRGIRWRFDPLSDGARMTFPVERGDLVVLKTFLPTGAARLAGGRVLDDVAIAEQSPRPRRTALRPGYASCCDERLSAAVMRTRVGRGQMFSYTVRARPVVRSVPPAARGDTRRAWGWVGMVAAALASLVALVAVGRRRRRRMR